MDRQTVNPRGKKAPCTFDRGVAGNKIERVCSSETSLALRVDVALLGPIGVRERYNILTRVDLTTRSAPQARRSPDRA